MCITGLSYEQAVYTDGWLYTHRTANHQQAINENKYESVRR